MTFAISVVMPVKGDGRFLEEALRSITGQSMEILELLVVDDGMTPAAIAILERCAGWFKNLHILEGPGTGPAAARNIALKAAKGDVIAFLDDDDLWPAEKLAAQCDVLQRAPELQAVGGRIHWFSQWDDNGQPIQGPDDLNILFVNLGAFLYRSSVFEKLGLLDSSLFYSEDVDLMLRMTDSDTPFALLDRITLSYRRHPGTMTHARTGREKADFTRVLMASMRRCRADGKFRPRRPMEDYLWTGKP
jgi:glycosyltransferase involved in cell wall biosynthesis